MEGNSKIWASSSFSGEEKGSVRTYSPSAFERAILGQILLSSGRAFIIGASGTSAALPWRTFRRFSSAPDAPLAVRNEYCADSRSSFG